MRESPSSVSSDHAHNFTSFHSFILLTKLTFLTGAAKYLTKNNLKKNNITEVDSKWY